MDNRANILNCALELFAARGYDAVGVQEVAEAAGITKPTLYHYFGSKKGLLMALLDVYHGSLNQAVSEAADYHGNLPQTLTDLARAYFTFAEGNPVFYRMQLAMYFAPADSEAHQLINGRNAAQHALVEAVFKSATREHGNMRGRHALYAATIIGMLNTCIGMWLNGYLELNEDITARVLHQFEHGIYS